MPTYVCPCGQKFRGAVLTSNVVVCNQCGRRSKIPGTLPTPEPTLLPSDMLDELPASPAMSPDDASSVLSTSPIPVESRTEASSPHAEYTTRISIDWNRFIPAVVGLLLFLTIGGAILFIAPTWWNRATTSVSKKMSETASTVAHDQPTEPSWKDVYLGNDVYPLPSEAVDHPVEQRTLSGVHVAGNAHPIEQGLKLRIDVSKLLPTSDSPIYSLSKSAPSGATIAPDSGFIQWTVPLNFPTGIQELLVHRTFADMRSDPGTLFKVQVIPTQGPPPRVGMLAPDDPIQTDTDRKPIKFRGSTVYPLADYSLTAVVLSSKFYTTGEEAYVSPIDLALGWGCMSDESLLRRLDIMQGSRRYSFLLHNIVDEDLDDMGQSSANVHIIPSTRDTAHLLASVQRGDVVRLSGALVEVKRQNWTWRSSLTRDDRGDGACEVMWVDHAEILPNQTPVER